MNDNKIIAILPALVVLILTIDGLHQAGWAAMVSISAISNNSNDNNIKGQTNTVKIQQWNLTDDTNITFVYSKMNHSEAEKFCQGLAKKETVVPPIEVVSHLTSIHTKDTMTAIMQLLKRINKRVYIGGVVSKLVRRDSVFYNLRWLDGSPDDFRFMHMPNSQLHEMRPEEERCLAIDYSKGTWGAHKCREELMFICTTHINDPDAMKPELPMETVVMKNASPMVLTGEETDREGRRQPPSPRERDGPEFSSTVF